ncbi:uncharacterized protein LOC134107180 [Pungitius pungitius]|uniref:uncharacterized protein LOC134107180 n=1 Tax=Pungitius pungitius TaxID=134920 RepID=UPI002E12ACEC
MMRPRKDSAGFYPNEKYLGTRLAFGGPRSMQQAARRNTNTGMPADSWSDLGPDYLDLRSPFFQWKTNVVVGPRSYQEKFFRLRDLLNPRRRSRRTPPVPAPDSAPRRPFQPERAPRRPFQPERPPRRPSQPRWAPRRPSSPVPAPRVSSPPVPAPRLQSPPVPAPRLQSLPVPAPRLQSPPVPAPRRPSAPVPAPRRPSAPVPALRRPSALRDRNALERHF